MTENPSKFIPSEESWTYFELHANDIRDVIAQFANRELSLYDDLVADKDSHRMMVIMNHAWVAAPDERSIYQLPGFKEMCNLLDGTVEGFFADDFDNLTGMDLAQEIDKRTTEKKED